MAPSMPHMNVKLNLSPLGKVKFALHTLQGLLIFIAICIYIAMATKDGKSDGRGIFYGVLLFLTAPAVIYLVGVPMWERTQKFANVFAFLALDSVFTIFWLAAWAGMVAWVRAGQRSGAEEKKLPSGSPTNCTTFDEKNFGTEAKCNLANNLVGFGVVIFVLFIGTTVLSFLYFRKIRKDQVKEPWLGKSTYKAADPALESGDNAWSADVHDDHAQHNRRGSNGTERGGDQEEDEHHLLHSSEDPAGYHPANNAPAGGRPWEGGRYDHEEDIGYHGASGPPPYGAPASNPNVVSPSEYSPEYSRHDQAPATRYDDRTSFPAAPYGYDRDSEPRR